MQAADIHELSLAVLRHLPGVSVRGLPPVRVFRRRPPPL